MVRTKRVDSERELEKEVDEFVTRGYKIKQQSQYNARVKEKDYGSAPVHGFILLFSLIGGALLFDAADGPAAGAWVVAFLAVAVYAGYSWVTSDEIIIKVDQNATE